MPRVFMTSVFHRRFRTFIRQWCGSIDPWSGEYLPVGLPPEIANTGRVDSERRFDRTLRLVHCHCHPEQGFLLIFIFRWFLPESEFKISPYKLPHLFHLRRYPCISEMAYQRGNFPKIFALIEGSPIPQNTAFQVSLCQAAYKTIPADTLLHLCQYHKTIHCSVRWQKRTCRLVPKSWKVNGFPRIFHGRWRHLVSSRFLCLSCTFLDCLKFFRWYQSFKSVNWRTNLR